jgi:hypothetical protein
MKVRVDFHIKQAGGLAKGGEEAPSPHSSMLEAEDGDMSFSG